MTDCLFCRIVARESPADIEYEDDAVLAFKDIYPKAPVHVLIVPRRHFAALRDVGSDDWQVTADALSLASRVAGAHGLFDGGYRVITNDGPDAGQTVPHLHFHLLGGGQLQAGLG